MNSSDLLTILLSISVVFLTLLLCLALYYLVLILRRVHSMLDRLEENARGVSTGFQDMFRKIIALKDSAEIATKTFTTIVGLLKKQLDSRQKKKRDV